MKILTFAIIFISISVSAGQNLKSVFDGYSELQNSLAQDSLELAKKAAIQMLISVNGVKTMQLEEVTMKAWRLQRKNIQIALSSAVKSTEIKEMRMQFNLISKSVIALGLSNSATGLNRFHCPMAFGGKGADWLQKGDVTMNPFYGASMLRCGSMVNVETDAGRKKTKNHSH